MEIADVKQHIKTGKYTVYIHIFPNSKVYVGMTSYKPEYRWNNGKAYKGDVRRAIEYFGWDNVEHIIIAENLSYEDACSLESSTILEHRSNELEYGYNLTSGGVLGTKLSSTSCKRIGEAHKGKVFSDEHRKNLSESLKGREFSDDSRKKMSESHKGKKMTEEFKRKESLARMGSGNTFYGKHHSEETKARLREISKVKCAGKNNGMYGKKHSEETKRKIGEKSKGRIPWNKGKKYTIKEISNHGDSRCQADD